MVPIPPVVLQNCGNAFQCWQQAEFFEALAGRLDVIIGLAGFMMVVGTVTYVALYWWSKSHTVPTVVLTLTGGVFVGLMPAPVARIGWIIIFLSMGLALFALLWAVIR